MEASSAHHLGIEVETGPKTVVRLAGELDVMSAPDLWAVLDREMTQTPSLVLDMSGLEFVDSTGLGVLARAARECDAADGRITLQAPTKRVRDLLALTRLDRLFDMDPPPPTGG